MQKYRVAYPIRWGKGFKFWFFINWGDLKKLFALERATERGAAAVRREARLQAEEVCCDYQSKVNPELKSR